MASNPAQTPATPGTSDRRPTPLLQAFCPTPMGPSLQSAIQQRAPGTCQWIRQNDMFKAWLGVETAAVTRFAGTDKAPPSIDKLWLYGFHGSGRTTLAGDIVEELQRAAAPRQAVCYYFCDLLKPETTKSVDIMRTLLSQLAEQDDAAYEELRRCVEDGRAPGGAEEAADKPGFDYLNMNSLFALFHCMSRGLDRVSIVINAVDQCGANEGEVVQVITSLVKGSSGVTRALFTTVDSPYQQDLCMKTSSCPLFATGQSGDIQLYVQNGIKELIAGGASHLEPESVRSGLEEYIVSNSNGAWLWAVCELQHQAEALKQGTPLPPPSAPPQEAPDSYSTYGPVPKSRKQGIFPYGHFFDRVARDFTPRQQLILSRVLQWACASIDLPTVHLTVAETCEALSLKLKLEKTPSGTDAVTEAEILATCGPLVRKSPDGTSLQLRHVTVHGYLATQIPRDKPRLSQFRVDQASTGATLDELALLCIRILSDPSLVCNSPDLEQDMGKIRKRDAEHPFYGYAATRWPIILQGRSDNFQKELSPILETGSAVFASWVLEHARRLFPDSYAPSSGRYATLATALADSSVTAMHVAAALSLPNTCLDLRKTFLDVDQPSCLGSPLWCALVGSAAFGAAADPAEPPWRRFRRYGKQYRKSIAQTVDCMLELDANCSELVPSPQGDDDDGAAEASLASQALYTSAWLADARFFTRIVRGGAALDRALAETLRGRAFMFDVNSVAVRPIAQPVAGDFRTFLNDVYTFLLQELAARSAPGDDDNADSDADAASALRQVWDAVRANVTRDDLECASLLKDP